MPESPPALHALLIGIDRYPRPPSGVVAYPSLYGAVADALRVEEYLREVLEVPASKITRLLAPHAGGDSPRAPTLANLTGALRALEEACRPGDHALVYYSGHGGRAPTLIPEVKGEAGIDEVLVPADTGDPAVPYLRDIEIAVWLARCSARGVFVTLVLDCCHSGGAVRFGRRVRGIGHLDWTRRRAESGLAGREEILTLQRPSPVDRTPGRREILPARQAPTGFALLAACRPQERALEVETPEGWQGVLTSCLLETLSRGGLAGLTYRRLHGAVTSRLHAGGYLGQTPVLDGEADRLVFGRERVSDRRPVEVVEVEGWPGERVRLSSGRLQGTRGGERFRIYEPRASVDGADPVAEAEVIEVGTTSSWARPMPVDRSRPVRPGDGAVLVSPGRHALRRTVVWVSRKGVGVDPPDRFAALLELEGDGLLALAGEGAVADFEVDSGGEDLQLRDAGGRILGNLGRPIPATSADANRELVRKLVHLARYWNIRALENPDRRSQLEGGLRMHAARISEGDGSSSGPGEEELGVGDADPLLVSAGTTIRVTLENAGQTALNVAVLDLQPDWGIRQVLPHRDSAPWASLEPGTPLVIDLVAQLPSGLLRGIDLLKAFGATVPFDLAGLELPAIQISTGGVRRGGIHPAVPTGGPFGLLLGLGAVLRAVPLRSGNGVAEDWTVAELEICVQARGGIPPDSQEGETS